MVNHLNNEGMARVVHHFANIYKRITELQDGGKRVSNTIDYDIGISTERRDRDGAGRDFFKRMDDSTTYLTSVYEGII